jgi:hypothetical protein
MSIRHFLLTAFSIPAPQAPGRNRDAEWLRFRLNLLEKVGAPSVRFQSTTDFRWLILIDDKSDAWVRNRLQAITDGTNVDLVPVGRDWREQLRSVLLASSPESLLLTSQMDSDDAIGPTFMESVRRHAAPDAVVNASVGARFEWTTRRLVLVRRKRAFESLCSTRMRIIFDYHHGTAGLEHPSFELGGSPLWVQTIHGVNLANRSMRGLPIRPSRIFEPIAGLARRPHSRDYAAWISREIGEFRHRVEINLVSRVGVGRSTR